MITERMQKRTIYECWRDEPTLDPDEIDLAGWQPVWREVFLCGYRAQTLGEACVSAVDGDWERGRELMREIEEALEEVHYPTLAEIAANLEPVTWLWEGWLPRGMLAMVGAYQGTGKSYLVMDLARIVLHGGAWPDGAAVQHDPASAKVLYVDAEGIPQVNAQRANALGVDTNRMYLLTAAVGEMLDLTRQHWRDRLLDLAYAVTPQLVIIDSLNTITTAGTKSVEDVSDILSWLNGMARSLDLALVLVHHLRKPGGGQLMLPGISIHDFQGSAHITAMARSVIGMSVVQQKGRQFSLNGPRQIEVVKTNLTPRYPARLAVTLEQPTPDTVRFAYNTIEADDEPDDEQTPEDWLCEYLAANGPTGVSTIQADAAAAGYSRATLFRARQKLGARIVDSHGARRRGNRWLLADQDLDSAADGEDEDDDGAENDAEA